MGAFLSLVVSASFSFQWLPNTSNRLPSQVFMSMAVLSARLQLKPTPMALTVAKQLNLEPHTASLLLTLLSSKPTLMAISPTLTLLEVQLNFLTATPILGLLIFLPALDHSSVRPVVTSVTLAMLQP